MDYLKRALLSDIADEKWVDRGHGGYPSYTGNVELWRAPSAAWNIGDVASRQILVRLGHSGSIRLQDYGAAYNDLLNMRLLGIIGDAVPDYIPSPWMKIWKGTEGSK